MTTVIMCGAHDAEDTVRKHTFVADLIPDAVLHVFDGAGHFPTLEAPDNVAAKLQGWFQTPLRLT
ncbi:alpha/beta fold hydrolase [Ruegeria conchae]|uniref:alpha/beta fold hydrolase n=1 Tax=Ruegeria conchae TaxID=981384 RepID=UPI00288356ED|nr:alpha/beta hydrolase [Ruegeria conchae]